jgi:hypothetical protein
LLNPDYRDMLSAFDDEKVEYLVVGAYALAAHGLPRATGDIDLWVRPTSENAQRVWKALVRFGAPLEGLSVSDLTTPGIVFQIGVAPRRIDILTSIDAVAFGQAWECREQIRIDDETVPVLSREHLITNKKATGRTKDQYDVEWLERHDSSGGQP